MDTLIIVLLIVILAELTYTLAKQPAKLSTKAGRPIFVDTSVLIDGRIIAVAQSGFIGDTLVIPRSVVGELQFLADNADAEKRSRARHGLDVVRELQDMTNITVEILQDGSKAEEGVDERLLKLAKQHSGAICTIDFNLNKVAQVENIAVLNVNELAKTLRMAYLPGEKLVIGLIQKGQDSHQAVGYLADGTMVVVEHAANKIGQSAEVEFIRSLQTAAGKMMFAKLVHAEDKTPAYKKPQGRKNNSKPQVVAEAEVPAVAVVPQSRPNNRRKTQKPHGQSRAPKTSVQREASLIEQINNQ
ncbi:MAG: putative PilT domain containing protein [Candidatus Saccharibacteria bacterium]|nr:putative PilT domain containing protein [Candidatus Saccharibacteria bacterium]